MNSMSENTPKRKPLRLPLGSYADVDRWYFVTICANDKKWHFEAGAVRDTLVQAIRWSASQEKVEIMAYVVMPNHVHLVSSCGTNGLPDFVRHFKGIASKRLREEHGLRQVWQTSYFDHIIRGDESLEEKCEYVRQNPIRWNLATRIDDYPW